MEENEIIYSDVPLVEEQDEVVIDEVMPVIEMEETEGYDIDLQEAFPSTEGNTSYNHALLNNREINDAHPISAITGLRAELNAIEALKTVYSDEKGNADYYEWAAGYVIDGVGRFVTLNRDTRTITICTGDDIFGVVVDKAAFVGGQDDIARDGHYGMVATSGIVNVRCELDVEEGNYVVSNAYGIATKATSDYGYKVVALQNINGLVHATINLNISANQINLIGAELKSLDGRVDANYTNIVSAVNLAQQAYDKATRIGVSNQEMSDKVDGALNTVGKLESSVTNMGSQVSNSMTVATQAQAIANGAVTYAASMKDEAVAEANKALAETSDLRKEFEAKVAKMNTDLKNASLELETTKESIVSTKNELQGNIDDAVKDIKALEQDLEPLATWPEGSDVEDATGVAGFVARANKDSVTLGNLVTWKNGDGDESLSGYVSKATSENAEIKALAAYTYTDKDGTEHKSVAALDAYANENKAAIDAIVGKDGSLAGLQAQVNENTASVTTLASHVIGDYVSMDTWDETKGTVGTIYYAEDTKKYHYYDNGWKETDKPYEAGLSGALAGIQQTADDNTASIKMITSLEGEFGKSLAGFVSEATAENAEIKALAEYGYIDEDGKKHYGAAGIMAEVDKNKSAIEAIAGEDGSIAGLQAQVDANKSAVDLVAKRVDGTYESIDTWDVTGKDEDVIYYAKDTKCYWYYVDGGWKNTTNASEAGLSSAIAGLQVQTDDHSSKINSLTSWQGDTNIAMTRIEQKADANGAYIQSTVSNMDKYAVGPHSQAFGFTLEQAKSVLEKGMIYTPTEEEVNESYVIDNEPTEWFEDEGENIKKNPDKIYYKTIITDGESIKEYWHYSWDEKKWVCANPSNQIPSISRKFLKHYLYKWGELDNGSYGWITVDKKYSELKEINDSAKSVFWSHQEIAIYKDDPNNKNYGYWYAVPNEDGQILDIKGNPTEKYEPHTLYKWDLPYKYQVKDENGDIKNVEDYHWVAVATLAGNSSNRAVSQIRQDANSITAEIVDAYGNVAGFGAKLLETEATVQTLASWQSNVADDVSNISTIQNKADATGASVAQVAASIGGYETWDGSFTRDTSKIYYYNQKYYYYKDSEWKNTINPIEAGVVINAASIVTAVNNDTSGVTITADHINLQGAVTISSLDNDVAQQLNNAVASTKIEYALSDGSDPEDAPTSGWSTTAPDWEEDKYMWQKTTITYTDTTKTSTVTMTCIQGAKGEQGDTGADGTSVTVESIQYQAGISATTTPTGTWSDTVVTVEEGQYLWSKTTFSDGNIAYGVAKQGISGQDGQTGTSVTKVVTRYYISTSNAEDDKPTDTASDDNGWFEDFDTMLAKYWDLKDANTEQSYYIWAQEKVDYDNDTSSYSTPTVNGASSVIAMYCKENGVTKIDGGNIATNTITADHISTNDLSSISANLGTVNAGCINIIDDDIVKWDAYSFTYTLNADEETYTLTGRTEDYPEQIVIPSVYEGKAVTAIGDSVFSGTYIQSVIIPDSITSIGKQAFQFCGSLISVVIGNGVTNIGDFAFRNCQSLEYIKIGNNVASIGSYAFYSCSSLVNIEIPESVTSMGGDIFGSCTMLRNVAINGKISEIPSYAFNNCRALACIIIPAELQKVNSSAFGMCSNLSQVYYKGTQSQKNMISFDSNNTYLTRARWYYYNEDHSLEGRGWHYNEDTLQSDAGNPYIIKSKYFTVYKDGTISAKSGTFKGELSAATGTFAGSLSAANGTFRGTLSAVTGSFNNCTIGGKLTFGGNTNYYINAKGDTDYYINLPGFQVNEANGAVFSGILTAPGGSIGGFKIEKTKIYSGESVGGNSSVYLSTSDMPGVEGFFEGTGITDWRLTVGSKFGVTRNGSLYADEANISGRISAATGQISNFYIKGSGTTYGLYGADDEGTAAAMSGGGLTYQGDPQTDITGCYLGKNGINLGRGHLLLYANANETYGIVVGHTGTGTYSTMTSKEISFKTTNAEVKITASGITYTDNTDRKTYPKTWAEILGVQSL